MIRDDRGDLYKLVATGRQRHVAAGTTVLREGDPGTGVYACRSGRLKVTVTTPTGREIVFGFVQPGDVFGELSALDGHPRSANVIAMERSTITMLTGDELLDALTASPQLALSLLRSLSEYLRSSSATLVERTDTSAPTRLARRLLHLVSLTADASADAIELPITQGDLAAWTGVTREATARALATLRSANVVRTARGTITVVDVDRLADLAAG
jgi:CRP/FNR family transcriptional regulator, cyclic AMP receptor protein